MSDDPRVLRFPDPDDAPSSTEDTALGARIAALYAATPAAEADAAQRCTRAILAAQMHAPTRSVGGTLRPRWWWGAAAAALLVAGALTPWRTVRPPGDRAVAGAADAQSMPFGEVTPVDGGDAIRFDLRLPSSAKAVAIVGDFNGWDAAATPMRKRDGSNGWSAKIELPPGRHVYAFVVDGTRWLVDPLAPQVSDGGFGPSNAVLVEGGPQ